MRCQSVILDLFYSPIRFHLHVYEQLTIDMIAANLYITAFSRFFLSLPWAFNTVVQHYPVLPNRFTVLSYTALDLRFLHCSGFAIACIGGFDLHAHIVKESLHKGDTVAAISKLFYEEIDFTYFTHLHPLFKSSIVCYAFNNCKEEW